MQELIAKHRETLQKAVDAQLQRHFFSHWPEVPSGKIYGENANAEGFNAFEKRRNQKFTDLLQQGEDQWIGEEISPYGFPLHIQYPHTSIERLIANAQSAMKQWTSLTVDARAATLIESLERASKHFFEIAYATMHTTGQGFVMAFQASGPHAFDRALEAIATGFIELSHIPTSVQWEKPMGKSTIVVNKRYYHIPKGIGAVIGCSTFPVWNSTPGIFANLITGNAVIVKPHPRAVLPIAILVAAMQRTFAELGIDPHIIQLAVDSSENPITLPLVQHPAVALIDFTGSSAVGNRIEQAVQGYGKETFMEKSGVNCLILESVQNVDAVFDNIAFSLCLYSGQMCTTPQNLFIPVDGIATPDGTLSFDAAVQKLIEKINTLISNPKMGPSTLGAIQSEATMERIARARALGLPILRESEPLPHPEFPDARTATPLLLKAEFGNTDIYEQEWFGPISFLIPAPSYSAAVDAVTQSAQLNGALTALVYTTDDEKKQLAVRQIALHGKVPLGINFTGWIWINQSAAFSDFHGSGANPAGNAVFTDSNFVTRRFNIVGVRDVP